MNFTGSLEADPNRIKMSDAPLDATHPLLNAESGGGYSTKNKSFRAKSKQIFAALNYAGRPRGATICYGYSYLVLWPALKLDAIYFGGDTFALLGRGAKAQTNYMALAAVVQTFMPDGLKDVFKSCYENLCLPDSGSPDILLEAHLFRKLKFKEDVQELALSRKRKPEETPWTDAEWQDIVDNATD